MLKITLKPTITKEYRVETREFKAGHTIIGTASEIGLDMDKIASSIGIAYFFSVVSSHNFMHSIYLYSRGTIYFVTNVTQELGFKIVWQEYI